MRVCQHCKSDRVLSVSGKCSDCCSANYKDREHEGYVPSLKIIGGGDYIEIDVCLECGRLQGEFPVPEGELDEKFPLLQPDPDVENEPGAHYMPPYGCNFIPTMPNNPIPEGECVCVEGWGHKATDYQRYKTAKPVDVQP